MLQPANSVSGTSSTPATPSPSDRDAGTDQPHKPTGLNTEDQTLLHCLPSSGTWSEQVVKRYYAACADGAKPSAPPAPRLDMALLGNRLAEWRDDHPADMPRVTDQRVVEDLQSALIAAVAIGMAHSVEMVLMAFSNHPLVRVCAVSHPYVVATFIESTLKRLAGVQDPDPENRTGIRYQEKIAAALINWNHVQPALDTVLKTPLARCLKVVSTAVISAVRDVAERTRTVSLLQDLPADAPPGPAKLTDAETLFVNCLMCWLRNVGVDVIRQVVRSGGAGAVPATGAAASALMERFLRPVFLGNQVPGALPAAAISAQPALAAAIHGPAGPQPGQSRIQEILHQAHDPF